MNMIWISVVDSEYRPIKDAEVSASDNKNRGIKLRKDEHRWKGQDHPNERITISVSARGFEPENHKVTLRDEVTQVVIGLRRPGQLSYSYGDSLLAFTPVEDAFLVRIRGERVSERFPAFAQQSNLEWRPVLSTSVRASDELFIRVKGDISKAQGWIRQFSAHPLTAQLFRSIEHGERDPLGLGNEIVVRFQNQVKRVDAERIAENAGLQIVRELRHAGNAFVLASKGEPSYDILKSADLLLRNPDVIYAEPNLTFAVQSDGYTPNDPLWAQVPHLQLIDVDDAWDLLDNAEVSLRGGSQGITIAVIDLDGVTPDHPDLTANLTDGTSKLVTSINFTTTPIADQTVAGLAGNHGTLCAGSATATFDDTRGIPGVAPNCHLIGARIFNAMDIVLMADIYLWAGGFLNGSNASGFPTKPPALAADVISSSWGINGLPLSDTIRDCFDFLTTYGRGGKGCVLCFSLGNNGYVDFTDAAGDFYRAWPTYEKTIAVGASINTNPTNPVPVSLHADPDGNTTNIATAVDTRALYSPYGATALRKPDLVAPSDTAKFERQPNGIQSVDPILSTVRVGTGDIDGCPGTPVCNDYAYAFGGTSHATPTVAGAAALVLSAGPSLNWIHVREILQQTCARIDAGQTNAIGQWQDLDGDALIDYSRWYGAGRIDVDAAVAHVLSLTLISPPDLYKWVAVFIAIFGGVAKGGGGWAVFPSGKGIPIPPPNPDPLLNLSKDKQDILVGLAVTELASIINNSEARLGIEKAGVEAMSKAVEKLKESLASKSLM